MEKLSVITKQDIAELETQAITVSEEAIIKITSQEKLKQANDIMAKLKTAKKFIAEKKASIISPLNLALKNSRALFKPMENKISIAEDNLKTGILDYKQKVEDAIKAQQEKIEKKVEVGEISSEEGSERIEKVEVKTNNFKTRKLKEMIITDKTKVPQEYWIIDLVALRHDVLAGKKVAGTEMTIKEIAL